VAERTQSGSVFPTIPDYEIEGQLGRGGMGVVYRARQTTLNRPVAIKMILGGKYTDPMAQTRFLIEAEVIAAIQNPHIVQLFQYGRHDDQPFFVLEFVGGGSLAGRLKAAGHFTPRDAATMVARLADGISAAHLGDVAGADVDVPGLPVDSLAAVVGAVAVLGDTPGHDEVLSKRHGASRARGFGESEKR